MTTQHDTDFLRARANALDKLSDARQAWHEASAAKTACRGTVDNAIAAAKALGATQAELGAALGVSPGSAGRLAADSLARIKRGIRVVHPRDDG